MSTVRTCSLSSLSLNFKAKDVVTQSQNAPAECSEHLYPRQPRFQTNWSISESGLTHGPRMHLFMLAIPLLVRRKKEKRKKPYQCNKHNPVITTQVANNDFPAIEPSAISSVSATKCPPVRMPLPSSHLMPTKAVEIARSGNSTENSSEPTDMTDCPMQVSERNKEVVRCLCCVLP